MEKTSENVFTNEELDIIARSKAAGCYMQAPNGQPTNLNERQWVQVRTGAFKEWFGDWEKAARIKKLYNARLVEITGNEIAPVDDLKQYKKNALEYGKNLRGEYTNKDTNTPISLTGGNSRGGIREILQHDYKDREHLQSIAAIPRIIEDSIFIDELPNEDAGKYPGIKSFSYYVCGLKIGGSSYTVKAVVANQNNGIRYYDHRLSSIEKSELLSIIPTIQKAGIESNPLLSDFKDKRLFSILQTNSSKVVDENGEPLVVYHGSHETFYEFNRWGDGFINSGHFFSSDKRNASGYGEKIYDVYLNLRTPLMVDAQGANFSSIVYGGVKMAASDLANVAEIEGYDGAVILNVADSADMKLENGCTIDYISFTSSQIKSATHNAGSFLRYKKDIRFREVYHGSPACFEHFDHAFAGTGEGAQAYGWGTYVTEVDAIAKRYAAIGIKRGNHITYDGEPLSSVLDNEYYFDDVWRVWKTHLLSSTDPDSLKQNVASVYIDGRVASPRSRRRKEFERQKTELLADIDGGKIRVDLPRNLYRVNIPEDNGTNYLYWDRPVSAEQKGRIFLQLRKERLFLPGVTTDFWNGKSNVWNSGKEFYGFLDYMFINPDRDTDSQRLASGFLSRAGFTGIDYPAEYSTGGRADGARNYVIFNENDLKITAHERFRFIGEKGASNLDRFEGACPRLENLAVARSEQIFLSREARMDELARHASFLAGKQHIPVEVIRRADEVSSPDVRGLLSCGKDIRGWYDIPSQHICLYLPHARGKADIERTLLHEGVAHYGLRRLVGDGHMDAFLDEVFAGCGEKLRDEITRLAGTEKLDIRVATEEYLAHMAESGTDLSVWERISLAFRNLLRKLGFNIEVDTKELRGILHASGQNLRKAETAAVPEKIRISGGELILGSEYGSACIRKRGSEADVTPVLEKMREAGVKPASLTPEQWRMLFSGRSLQLNDGRMLMVVKEPSGYGVKLTGVAALKRKVTEMEL